MARKPRIQFEGAFYHIIVRGNQRQDIFLDDADYREYLQRLGRYKGGIPGSGLRVCFQAAMAKEMGYRLSELQEVLKRDLSVVSRLASVGESSSAMKTMKAVKRRLKANLQA